MRIEDFKDHMQDALFEMCWVLFEEETKNSPYEGEHQMEVYCIKEGLKCSIFSDRGIFEGGEKFPAKILTNEEIQSKIPDWIC